MTRKGSTPKAKRYACNGYKGRRRGTYARHHYVLCYDSDGNYRVCVRPGCGKVSLRLAVGERDKVRM